MSLQTRNPATGDVLETYPELTPAELDAALDRAVAAQRDWRTASFAHRAQRLLAVADALEARADHFAKWMALEMGKPFAQGVAEGKKSASVCRLAASARAVMAVSCPATG